MKIKLLTIIGTGLILFSLYNIFMAYVVKVSVSPNDIVSRTLIDLGTGVEGIGCLFMAFLLVKKQRKKKIQYRKWENDFR